MPSLLSPETKLVSQNRIYLSVEDQKKIKVVPLPSDITIAREWFWALPANSAAPEVGLDLIKLLTKHEAELERM